jgi:hypothetical protein
VAYLFLVRRMKPQDAIFKFYTTKVAQLGFARLRIAWWERQKGVLLQRIHIHKFTSGTSFRVHGAVHLRDFEEGAVSLNGFDSYDGWFEQRSPSFKRWESPDIGGRKFSFRFTQSSVSWQHCADELFSFTRDVLVPWFANWEDENRLVHDDASPLSPDQKAVLGERLTNR